MINKVLKNFSIVLILSFYALLLAQPINLATSDLGRHLKNGEIILQQGLSALSPDSVLNSNFYSYTQPNYPFINHHWLSGVVFFEIHKLAGFAGLSLFYIFLSLLAFIIFFTIAKLQSGFKSAMLSSLILIPLIAQR